MSLNPPKLRAFYKALDFLFLYATSCENTLSFNSKADADTVCFCLVLKGLYNSSGLFWIDEVHLLCERTAELVDKKDFKTKESFYEVLSEPIRLNELNERLLKHIFSVMADVAEQRMQELALKEIPA